MQRRGIDKRYASAIGLLHDASNAFIFLCQLLFDQCAIHHYDPSVLFAVQIIFDEIYSQAQNDDLWGLLWKDVYGCHGSPA